MIREDHGTRTEADSAAYAYAHRPEPDYDHPDARELAEDAEAARHERRRTVEEERQERARLVREVAFWQAGAA